MVGFRWAPIYESPILRYLQFVWIGKIVAVCQGTMAAGYADWSTFFAWIRGSFLLSWFLTYLLNHVLKEMKELFVHFMSHFCHISYHLQSSSSRLSFVLWIGYLHAECSNSTSYMCIRLWRISINFTWSIRNVIFQNKADVFLTLWKKFCKIFYSKL